MRSSRLSARPLKPSSNARRRFCSANRAIVFSLVLADSRMRLPAKMKSYHQIAENLCLPVFGSLKLGLNTDNLNLRDTNISKPPLDVNMINSATYQNGVKIDTWLESGFRPMYLSFSESRARKVERS